MDESAAVRRGGSDGWRLAMWVAGTALGGQLLTGLVFVLFIGIGEAAAVAFGLTEEVGVPVFWALLACAVVAHAAIVHLVVRTAGKSVAVPWAIWPAMAVLPTAWIFIALAAPVGALEPTLAVLNLIGIALAFVTLGERRWTGGPL